MKYLIASLLHVLKRTNFVNLICWKTGVLNFQECKMTRLYNGTKIIGTSNLVSTYTNTNVPENEGQYIQSVYVFAYKYGGPGEFSFDK